MASMTQANLRSCSDFGLLDLISLGRDLGRRDQSRVAKLMKADNISDMFAGRRDVARLFGLAELNQRVPREAMRIARKMNTSGIGGG